MNHDLKEIDTIHDASFVSSLLVSTFEKDSWFEYQCINSNIMVERELVCSYDTTHNPDLVYPSRMKARTPNKCQGCLF